MWTAKRIVILMFGLLICVSSFWIYALFLGVIDGLRTLPPEYLPPITKGPEEPPPPNVPPADRRLELAFGIGCKELQRPLRLWLPDKGIVFSAGNVQINKDGKGLVHLAPFSAAIFHKSKGPNAFPEISTIQSDVAIVTLDQPVTSPADLNNRKIVAVEMVGTQPGIVLGNNRRTIEKHDDIDILITNGSLFYEERRNLIWTDGVVCLTDHQTKPPTVIRGTGMDMTLAKDTGPKRPNTPKAPAAEPNHDNGNIEKIKLRADVQMHFWTEPNSGFLGGTPGAKKPPQPAVTAKQNSQKGPPDKALIHIKTGGPFVYDLTKEFAWFESPPTRDGNATKGARVQIAPDQVSVERLQTINGKKTCDQLVCDRLELQFRRKPNFQAATDKEIETAKATRWGRSDVVLALETDAMAAYCTELFYRAGDAANGPMTILKGEPEQPVRAGKDGHRIKCQEMHLFAANSVGEGQRAWARGPGQIDMLDTKNPEKESFPTHVLWRDTLDVVKVKEGTQVFDRMTVVGEASFIDEVQKQELHGEKILVWVLQTRESEQKNIAVGGGRQELHRVIALDRVRALSPDFIVRRCNILTMTFIPELPRDERLPAVVANKPATLQPGEKPPPGNADKEPTPLENKPRAEEKKANAPIELEGNDITAVVFTLGAKKQLQELIAKGNVYVFQAGEKQGEKGIDITGQILTVNYAERGHTLVVHGDKDKLARLELGDTIIWGPLVTVNQAINHAEVEGHGAMEMPSNKSLDGSAAAKKGARITIYWNKNMTFDGLLATFNGGVQAKENGTDSKIQCQVLTAILDRTVSFKEGQKKDQNAKIDRLVMDKNVFVFDWKVDERKQLLQGSILQGWYLTNHQDGPTNLRGPGEVRHLARGSSNLNFAPPSGADNANPGKTEWKLTHVIFRDDMWSTSKNNVKTVVFRGQNSGVEVFHFPTIKIEDKMNADRPPKDGLYLRCEILEVESKQINDRTTQSMIARRNVLFKTDQYLGYCDVLKFDEKTDMIIMEGTNGNHVRLYRVVGGDLRPASVNSSKVLYNRKTGKLDTEGVTSITN